MARPRAAFPAGFAAEAKRMMKSCSDDGARLRLQAVYLAAEEDLPNAAIARATGLSINTIRVLHVRVRRDGVASLLPQPRGGRYRQHLSSEREATVLAQVIPQAERGGVVVVREIQSALEREAGRTYHAHSVYRLLARQGWRKVAPRRQHADQAPEAVADFQKSGAKRSMKSVPARKNAGGRGASSFKTKPASDASATRAAAGRRATSGRPSTPGTSANTSISSVPSIRSPAK
jgi:transposase